MLIWETIRFLLIDLIGNVVYFPLWWYTTGTIQIIQLITREISGFAKSLNLRILFQFLLTPMYGYNDITSRIISFFVRIGHFAVLLTATIVYTVVLLLLLVLWLVLPIFVLYNLIFHFEMAPELIPNIYQSAS